MKRQRISVPRVVALVALLLGFLAASHGMLRRVSPPAVNAEEQGITVSLSYQAGLSTWGPTNVYGTAQLWPIEGVATISVHFLPHLLKGEDYVWWVLSSASGSALRLGVFNTTDAGDALQDVFLSTSFPAGADTVLVTLAGPHDDLTKPGRLRTLAGHFALPPGGTAQPSSTALAGQHTSSTRQHPAQSNATTAVKTRKLPTTIHYTHKLKLPVAVAVLPQTGGGPY